MVASGKSELGWFNSFSTNIPLLYPLKTSEILRFSDVFMGYKNRTLVENGLNTDFVQVFGWHWRKLEEAEATIHRSFIKNLFSWKISKFCVFLKKAGCSFIKKDTPIQVFFSVSFRYQISFSFYRVEVMKKFIKQNSHENACDGAFSLKLQTCNWQLT